MRLSYYVPLSSCISACLATKFINPPAEDERTDSSLNAVYAKGSNINIQWTPVDSILAITFFQLNRTDPNQFLPGLENIVTNLAPNATSFVWNVQTKKSLEESPIFFMNLFPPGATSSLANSQPFNISLPGGVQPQSSSSSVTPTSSLISTKESPTSSTASTTSSTTSSPLTTTSASGVATSAPGGLSSGAKAGVGIGVSAAIVLGFAAGWWFFGRKKVGDKLDTTSTAGPEYYYEPTHDTIAAIPQQPQELPHKTTPDTPMRYELSGQR